MKHYSNALILSVFLTGSVSYAKAPVKAPTTAATNMKSSALTEKNLVEELTGKKSTEVSATHQNLKNAPLPFQHFYAGQKAAAQKNYILAIKHFNTVIKKYPQSAQVKPALLAKAKVYQEMGLQPQAERNVKLAQLKKANTATASAANINQQKNKITK